MTITSRTIAALMLLTVALSLGGCGGSQSGSFPPAADTNSVIHGGSVFGWTQPQTDPAFFPDSVAVDYFKDKSRVDYLLSGMRANGQGRLAVFMIMNPGPSVSNTSPFNLSAAGLNSVQQANIAGLFQAIRDAGFSAMVLEFNGLYYLNPNGQWDEARYQTIFRATQQVRALAIRSRVSYTIDLAEEMPDISDDPLLPLKIQLMTRLWSDYTARFGKADTVGFSFTAWDRVVNDSNFLAIYGANPPDILDAHFYPWGCFTDAYASQVELDTKAALRNIGYNQPWIIGETFYNDADVAGIMAANLSQIPIKYVIQWPIRRSDVGCTGAHVLTITVNPTEFSAYEQKGF